MDKPQAYAWKDGQLVSCCFVKIIDDDGNLLHSFESKFISDNLRHNIGKWAKDYDVKWLDQPWKNQSFIDAIKKYEFNYGIRLDCREY